MIEIFVRKGHKKISKLHTSEAELRILKFCLRPALEINRGY